MIGIGKRVRVIKPNDDVPTGHSGWGDVEDVDNDLLYVRFDGRGERDSAWFRERELTIEESR
jgi:hypothetical protein